jgi:aspartate/methionine/tyrosine aminotransferase
MLAATSTKTKLVVVNFPHNPTGALPTTEEWQEIIHLCREHGCFLFCDEMYRCLEHDGVDRLDPAVEAYERGISLSGLSKAFGLAGLRMGWIASRDMDFVKRVQQIKDYTTICTASPSQVLSLIALKNSHHLLERCQRIVHNVRDEVKDFCRQNNTVLEWTNPRAGTFVFPKLVHPSNQGARSYCDQLLNTADIMLLPSSLFEYGEHKGDDSRVRISLGRRSIPQTIELWKQRGL